MRLKLLTKEERAANRAKWKANERFSKLLTRLDSKTEVERLAAATELREQWPDGMQRLLSGYKFTANLWKNRWRLGVYSLLWLLAGNVIVAVLAFNGNHKIFPMLNVFWMPLWIFVFYYYNGSKLRNSNVRRLLIFEDVKIVGPLVDALAFRDEITQQEARKALVGLLPRLQASDAPLLNGEQRERLRQMLFTEYIELKVSVLKAYEHIGDAAELEAVERLLNFPIWDVEVREAAEACLPFLQLRAQQMQSSQILLRAAQPAAAPDILLRPAAHASTEDETQLLRMSGSGH